MTKRLLFIMVPVLALLALVGTAVQMTRLHGTPARAVQKLDIDSLRGWRSIDGDWDVHRRVAYLRNKEMSVTIVKGNEELPVRVDEICSNCNEDGWIGVVVRSVPYSAVDIDAVCLGVKTVLGVPPSINRSIVDEMSASSTRRLFVGRSSGGTEVQLDVTTTIKGEYVVVLTIDGKG